MPSIKLGVLRPLVVFLVGACSAAPPGLPATPVASVVAATASPSAPPSSTPANSPRTAPPSIDPGTAPPGTAPPVAASTLPLAYDTLQCAALPGLGNYDNPIQLGDIVRSTVAIDCPPLVSGDESTVKRYYRFRLLAPAPVGSLAGASFVVASDRVPVEIGLGQDPYIVLRSSAAFTTVDRNGDPIGRWFPLNPLPEGPLFGPGGALPAGEYRILFEKLIFSVRAFETSPFHAVIQLGPDPLTLPPLSPEPSP